MSGKLQVGESPVVIAGGGPAGLGAAYAFQRAGFDDWILFERDEVVGGLARSFRDEQGFTWDVGGHVTFSHYGLFTRLMRDLLGPDGWIDHQRESWIRLLGTWVPYPFQNNVHRLPPAERADCAVGLVEAALHWHRDGFANFDDFILRTVGKGIADLFMRPYNRKVWAYDPTRMDAGWVAERVAVPDPRRLVRNLALAQDDCSWGPNDTFRFPTHGGTGAIWTALAQRLPRDRVRTGHEVVQVDPAARKVTLANGGSHPYGVLISTMPLDQLAQMSRRRDWVDATANLDRSSTFVIGVGLEGKAPEDLRTKCWMYFPEENCPFYRVTHFSLYSPNNSDDIRRHWSLMCEVSESPEKSVDGSRVVPDTVSGLVAAGLIDSPERVIHTWMHRAEYSYPVPTLGRDQVLDRLLPELYEQGILSRGRFGGWRYEVGNMDHAFMQGFEAAQHLLQGSPELTLWHPNVVNQRHPVLGWDQAR